MSKLNLFRCVMPYKNHDLTPMFDAEIDVDPIAVTTGTVSENGYVGIDSEFAHHTVAWAPFETGGQLRTVSFKENTKKEDQSYVQTDGSIKIGTEEWTGKKLLIVVLDQKIPVDE